MVKLFGKKLNGTIDDALIGFAHVLSSFKSNSENVGIQICFTLSCHKKYT